MSDSQVSQNFNSVLPKEWDALAKIGKTFRLLFILGMIAFCILILLFLINLALNASEKNYDFNILTASYPIIYSVIVLGVLTFTFVFLGLIFRFWATPESIVPGGKIVRAYIILCVIIFFFGFGKGYIAEPNPELSERFAILEFFFNIIHFIILLIYLSRLATAIGSESTKWFVNLASWGLAGVIYLILRSERTLSRPGVSPDAEIIFDILILIALVVGFGSLLFSFKCLSEDIPLFIKINHQEGPNTSPPQVNPEAASPQENSDATDLQENQPPIQE